MDLLENAAFNLGKRALSYGANYVRKKFKSGFGNGSLRRLPFIPRPIRTRRYRVGRFPRARAFRCRNLPCQVRMLTKLMNAQRGRKVINDTQSPNNVTKYYSLITMIKGDSMENRTGDHIHVYGVYLQLEVIVDTTKGNDDELWFYLMLDKTPEGSQRAYTEIFSHNINNQYKTRLESSLKRDVILRRKKVNFHSREVDATAMGQNPSNGATIKKYITVKWFPKRPIDVYYSANAGTIADVEWNNLYVMYNNSNTTADIMTVTVRGRVYFMN